MSRTCINSSSFGRTVNSCLDSRIDIRQPLYPLVSTARQLVVMGTLANGTLVYLTAVLSFSVFIVFVEADGAVICGAH